MTPCQGAVIMKARDELDQQAAASGDLILPPLSLRKGPVENRHDEVYVRTAEDLTASIALMLNLAAGSFEKTSSCLNCLRILDIGCGPMRLLTGLLSLKVDFAEYVGMDVQPESIEWAKQNIKDPRTRFYTIDMHNERYNPHGREMTGDILPEADRSFDLVVLRSVFTHMRLKDIGAYLREIHLVLFDEGKVYSSVFAEHGVQLEEENPHDYRGAGKGPLHRVRIDRHHFENLAWEAGFSVEVFCKEVLEQPTYLLSRMPSPHIS